jgi:hypothetical protein
MNLAIGPRESSHARTPGWLRRQIRATDCNFAIGEGLMRDEQAASAAEPAGTAWRAAAWWVFSIAVVLSGMILSSKPANMIEGALAVLGVLSIMFFAAIGLVFAIFGAVASGQVGDTRVAVMLPVLANGGLLLWFVVTTFGPK